MAMEILLDVGVVILIATLLWLSGSILLRKLKQLPPGPFPLPILGNLLHMLGPVPHRSLAELAKRYGPIMYLRLGSMPAVVVSSPKLARALLQTHDNVFASRPFLESAKRLQYGGDKAVATTPYGDDWRELRRMYSLQLFTAKRVQEFQPIITHEIKLMLQGLHKNMYGRTPLDLTACVGNLLENITCRILLGQRLSEVFNYDGHHGVTLNLKQILHQATVLFVAPVIGDLIPFLGFLDYKVKRAMDEWHSACDNLLEGVLAKREKSSAAAKNGSARDFLDVLMANDLSKDRVKSIILELLVAAIDSSSNTLDWAMAELLANPHVLTKLQEEVDAVVQGGPEKMVEEAHLPSLLYMKAVVKETLRKHTPAPLLIPHMSTQACNVVGYNLPRGTRLIVNAWAIGHDPQIWDDPERFFPERFLEADIDVRGKHFELLPFGSGRRSCPGMPLALPIVELTLSNLVHTFQWELPRDHTAVDMSEKFGLGLSRASPLI